jgi:hypothetical protein
MNWRTARSLLPMRQIKRLLLFASEVGVFLLGLVLSVTLEAFFGYIGGSDIASLTFISGLVLTIVGLFLFRRRNRAWKIEYDAVGWELSQAERKLHPTRFKYKRIAKRILVWVPSAIAAFVLFFFPVATHVSHPRSHWLPHYRLPIPWTAAVLPVYQVPNAVIAIVTSSEAGRFGLTPFWDGERPFSLVTFLGWGVHSLLPDGATQTSSRNFEWATLQ